MDDRACLDIVAGRCRPEVPDWGLAVLELAIAGAEARPVENRDAVGLDVTAVRNEERPVRIARAQGFGDNMGEFRIKDHHVRLVDCPVGIHEDDIAVGHGAIIIPVVTNLVGGQRHPCLFHLDIANGKHAAVFIVHRDGVGFKTDILAIGEGRCGAPKGQDGHCKRQHKSAKKHEAPQFGSHHNS